MKDSPFVHIIQTRDGRFLYDVNTNSIIELEKECWRYIHELIIIGEKEFKTKYYQNDLPEIKTIFEMMENGFLKSTKIKKIEHPLSRDIFDYLEKRLDGIILQVTQNCNLKCRYCSYAYDENNLNRSHSNKKMTWETAKEAIDFLHRRSKYSSSVAIGFYGGEPLLEYKLIKSCIEYVNKTFYHTKVRYNITTNGTIMNEDILSFLVENDVDLLISLDGPPQVHNKNRRYGKDGKGSFSSVYNNLLYIAKKEPEYYKKISFNSVVELDTEQLDQTLAFFNNDQQFVNMKHQYSLVSDDTLNMFYGETSSFRCTREESFFKNLIRYCRGYSLVNDIQYIGELKNFSLLLRQTNELPESFHNNGPCIPGQKRLHVDVNGVFRPCERVNELSCKLIIGNIKEGFDYKSINELLNFGQYIGDRCNNCWAIRLCRICCQRIDCFGEYNNELINERCFIEQKNIEKNLKDIAILKKCNIEF